MATTKIPVELSSTPGIVDNSNATAITIDSSENVGIGTATPAKAKAVVKKTVAKKGTISIYSIYSFYLHCSSFFLSFFLPYLFTKYLFFSIYAIPSSILFSILFIKFILSIPSI